MHAVGQVSHLAERGKGVLRCGTPHHHHHLSQESGSVRDLLPLSPPAAPPPSWQEGNFEPCGGGTRQVF